MSAGVFGLKIKNIPFALAGLLWFRYYESLEGSAWYQYQWKTEQWKDADTLIDPSLNYNLQFSYQDSTGNILSQSAMKTVMVGKVSVTYTPYDATITTEGFDSGYTLFENCSQKYFYNMPVSQMVSELADSNNLNTDITQTSDKFTIPQGDLSDASFIRQVCLPRAYINGKFDYFFYIENGDTVVFKPIDYGNKYSKQINFSANLNNAANSDNISIAQLQSLTLNFDRAKTVFRGAGNVNYRSYDTKTKNLYNFATNDNSVNYNKLAPKNPNFTATSRCFYSDAPFDYASPNNSQVNNTASSIWSRDAYKTFVMPIILNPGDCNITPGMILTVAVTKSNGQKHLSSGDYIVYSTTNTFHDGLFMTELQLIRRNYL